MYLYQPSERHYTLRPPGGFQRASIFIFALFGTFVTVIQIGLFLIRGEPYCPNEGCRIVEGLTAVPQNTFNAMGVLYFLLVALLSFRWAKTPIPSALLRLLLLSGLAAEGVLLGYQAFYAGEYCAYCLLILFLIVSMNIFAGLQQTMAGGVIMGTILTLFPLLTWTPHSSGQLPLTLENGTFAVRSCNAPTRRAYLVFSKDCPHCQTVVLEALERCTSCEIHFNPIERIPPDFLPGLTPTLAYHPEINVSALRILGIETVPVLVVENPDGFSFIRGDREILSFITTVCSKEVPASLDFPDPLLGENGCGFDRPCE
ncbi:MAG: hypothetical protein K6360_04745 [Deltaproteobacteria bacterium]